MKEIWGKEERKREVVSLIMCYGKVREEWIKIKVMGYGPICEGLWKMFVDILKLWLGVRKMS